MHCVRAEARTDGSDDGIRTGSQRLVSAVVKSQPQRYLAASILCEARRPRYAVPASGPLQCHAQLSAAQVLSATAAACCCGQPHCSGGEVVLTSSLSGDRENALPQALAASCVAPGYVGTGRDTGGGPTFLQSTDVDHSLIAAEVPPETVHDSASPSKLQTPGRSDPVPRQRVDVHGTCGVMRPGRINAAGKDAVVAPQGICHSKRHRCTLQWLR